MAKDLRNETEFTHRAGDAPLAGGENPRGRNFR
jgi:hypothetical protein